MEAVDVYSSSGRRSGRGSSPVVASRFVDATADFRRMCSELALGQMVHPPTFTMLDTMACISIGDPRMDSGIYPLPKELVPETDWLESDRFGPFVTSFDPTAHLSLRDLIWILDRILACEIAFHKSWPLSQTLFTSLHYHGIEDMVPSSELSLSPPSAASLPHPALATAVLKPYVIATTKCFEMAWQETAKGNVLEGEDAVTDTCGLSLFEHLSTGVVLGHLQRATDLLQSWQSRQTDGTETSMLMGALLKRLSLRKHILMISSLFSDQLSDSSQSSDAFPPALFHRTIRDFCGRLESDLTHLGANQPSALVSTSRSQAPSGVAATSFDPSYARLLQNAGGVPPRPAPLPQSAEIILAWQDLAYRWKQAAGLYETVMAPTRSQNRWDRIHALVSSNGCLFEQFPTTAYTRSLFQSCLCPPQRRQPDLLGDLFGSSTGQSAWKLSEQLSHTLNHTTSSHGDHIYGISLSRDSLPTAPLADAVHMWLSKGNGLLGNVLLDGMGNRPRAKRCLAKSFPRWRVWTEETSTLEERLTAQVVRQDSQQAVWRGSLKAVVQLQSLRIALDLVMSGFDLELLSSDQFSSAYWMANNIAGESAHLARELAAIGASQESSTQRAEVDCLDKCRQLWQSLAFLCQKTKPRDSSPPWTSSIAQRKASFLRRYKWLTLPSFDARGKRQNKFQELDALWDSYVQWEESQSLSGCLQLVSTGSSEAQESLTSWRWSSQKDPSWDLCHRELGELQALLQVSLTSVEKAVHTDAGSMPTDQAASGVDLGVFRFVAPADGSSHHPWFPTLVRMDAKG